MKNSNSERTDASRRISARNMKRLRNAIARRKLQEMQDEKILRSWLAEVWDQSTWSDEFDRNSRFH
jgi:hypothetical protein